MNNEVAFALVTFVKVLFRVDFENVIGHLEAYWLYLGRYFFTRFLNVAEGFV